MRITNHFLVHSRKHSKGINKNSSKSSSSLTASPRVIANGRKRARGAIIFSKIRVENLERSTERPAARLADGNEEEIRVHVCAPVKEKRYVGKAKHAREDMRRIGEEKGKPKPKPPEIASLPASCGQTFCMRLSDRSSRMHRWLPCLRHTFARHDDDGAATKQLHRYPTRHFRVHVDFFFFPPPTPRAFHVTKKRRSLFNALRHNADFPVAYLSRAQSSPVVFLPFGHSSRDETRGGKKMRMTGAKSSPIFCKSSRRLATPSIFPSLLNIALAIITSPFILHVVIFLLPTTHVAHAPRAQLVHSRPTPSILGLLSCSFLASGIYIYVYARERACSAAKSYKL